jgi:hypothetical protein
MSITPPITSSGAAFSIPAGLTLGQTSTHLPHRVQASTISSVRSAKAVSKLISCIARLLCIFGFGVWVDPAVSRL